MAHYIDVKPELLRWAIERSGLAIAEYKEAVEKWLSGEKKPTRPQLEKFAKQAMVPFGYLFLSKPPDENLPVPDFRTRTDERVRKPSPNLIETIFEMQTRQEWMREYLLDEGHNALPFVNTAKVGEKIKPLTQRMREELGLSENWAEARASWEEALRYLRGRIEETGILIFVNGVVGNNTHRVLDLEEFQGFVFVDSIVPLIFVNGADFKVAQMFTIAHELAHVWVGQSALFDLVATDSADIGVERYCNAVAAEFLVPAEKLERAWPKILNDDAVFITLAQRFKVSPIVIARRAKDANIITSDDFFGFYQRYMKQERRKQDDKESGGDFWKTQRQRLGRRFGKAVIAAAREGRLSYSDAYGLTRLYGESFDKYAQFLQQGNAE